ncbi:Bacteriochlorophyllide d C-12(1)-methyltransferase [Methanosarcinales archaeon]|nr:Bacteriochlorophyllide d C-12(1)-methyltransferase [Methanosarcinales archaeon]
MLTKLLFPPQWIPTQPYLSLPSLTAFLRANNCNVSQIDINTSFYDHLLSKKGLQVYYDKAQTKFHELESKKELSPIFQKQYAALSSSILFGNYVINGVEDAKNIIKSKEDFYDIEKLFNAFKILELGLKLASSAYYPSNLTFHSYDMRYSSRKSSDVLEAINDRKENIFIEYFEKYTLPEVLEGNPGLIGISIINISQLIPGLTLANLIKKADPKIHINIGGSVFTRLINEISKKKDLFSVFDSVIVHEGETALLDLIKHLDNGFDIRDIPNLIYKKGQEIIVNRLSSSGEDINLLPTPCFDGLPLDKYLSPELVIPVLSSRGCYWNRCTFCDHGFGYSGKYRPRDVDLLFDDIKTLNNKHKTKFFTFQDEGLSIKIIGALSDRIIDEKLDISWLADSRFESSFSPELGNKLSRAGCKMLYFGLESASERVLKCMDKGIKKENVLKICRFCKESGIWAHLFLIFGFPTETHSEARETMDFILHNSDKIRSMSFGSFQLTKHSKVYENPDNFNISKIYKDDTIDLSLWYDCEISKGLSKKDTEGVIQEFYAKLAHKYPDLPIWSNLDREHLFLYIARYKGSNNEVADLSGLIRAIQNRKKTVNKSTKKSDSQPVLNEGVFIGTFNFNLAQIIHSGLTGKGNKPGNLQKEKVNVLFDIDNNRIFTISDLARDILDKSNGESTISEIIDLIKEKYQIPYTEAESKCNGFLNGLVEKNIITNS